MGLQNWLQDGLKNLVTNLNTQYGKSYNATYDSLRIDDEQLLAMYRGDWIGRKVIDIPANDQTREWRKWTGTTRQAERMSEQEMDLDVRGEVAKAIKYARLYGGSLLYFGDGTSDPSTPLDVQRFERGQLQYLLVLSKAEISYTDMDRDVMSPNFGDAKMYSVSSQRLGSVEIHPSRVIRFIGNERPYGAHVETPWGDSIFMSLREEIRNVGSTKSGIAELVQEAKLDVIKMESLSEQLATTEGTKRVTDRFGYAMQQKSINNMLLIGGDEEFEQKTLHFNNLPEILTLYLQIAAGASDIPATRFLGQSPTGMNATGQSDLRNYYDMIASLQNVNLRPVLRPLDVVLMRNQFGHQPRGMKYCWNPLWQDDAETKSKIDERNARTAKIYAESGLVPGEVLAEGVKSNLVETLAFPSIEEAYNEFDDKGEEFTPVVGTKLTNPQPAESPSETSPPASNSSQQVADAKPRTLYVSRKVKNSRAILAWAREQGIDNLHKGKDLHVTIVASREKLDWMQIGEPWAAEVKIEEGGPRVVERLGENDQHVVLMFASSEVTHRHHMANSAGASWDFEEFQPHITVSSGSLINADEIEPYKGPIVLGPEIFEEFDFTG